MAREYPNKASFHAFQASLTLDLDDNSNQAEGAVDQMEGGEKTRIRAIKYLLSLQKKLGERNVPTERGLLYVDTWINQKQTKSTMISVMQLDESPVQEEPPSVAILLGMFGKLEETVPKDTLCVLEKCHGVMPKSWPKSLSMRQMTNHGIEPPL